MQDFEDDEIEISDLDTPDERKQSSVIYRIMKRVREIHFSPKTRTIIFALFLLIGVIILAYQLIVTLRPKSTSSSSTIFVSSNVHVDLQPVNPIVTILHANGIAYIFTVDGTLSSRRANDGTFNSQQASGGILSAQRASDGKLLWRDVVSISSSQAIINPILAHNLIFFTSQNSKGGHVDAFRANDGVLQWSFPTAALASAVPLLIEDNVAYILTSNRTIYALNANNGHLLWKYTTALSDPLSALLYASNGITAIRADTKTVSLLNTQDGSELWHYTASNYRLWQPSIKGGIAYIQSSENVLQARRLNDGKFLWQYTALPGDTLTFSIQDGSIYVNSYPDSLEALSMQDGTHLWQFKTNDGIHDWRIQNGLLFFTSSTGYLGVLRPSNGTLLWKFKASSYSNIFWFAATSDGFVHIIVDQPDSMRYTLRANNGTVVWQQPLQNFDRNSEPDTTDTTLYTRQSDGSIDAWSWSDGLPLWHYQPSAPVMQDTIADGMVYMEQEDGTLNVLHALDGTVAWSYPSTTNP